MPVPYTLVSPWDAIQARDANADFVASDLAEFNVMADPYDAKGDGVTDDTASIQSAITAAAGKGLVFFPPGTYRIASPTLVLPSIRYCLASRAKAY